MYNLLVGNGCLMVSEFGYELFGTGFENSKCSSLLLSFIQSSYPAGIYLLKVNNRNTRTRGEICSKLTIKIPEHNFEYISHLVLVLLLFEDGIAG